MKFINIILVFLVFFSCNQKSKIHNSSKPASKTHPAPKDTTSINRKFYLIEESKDTTLLQKKIYYQNYNESFLKNYPKNIKEFKNKFYSSSLGSVFSCAYYDEFEKNGKLDDSELFMLDSISTKKLFNDAISTDYGRFDGFYLYSIESPIYDFYPITVTSFGVAERPLLLVLFDKNGKFVNDIEVADSYGEIGGCLNSFFSNDSTLVREYEWELDENGIEQETRKEQVIIHKNGEYTVKVLESNEKK